MSELRRTKITLEVRTDVETLAQIENYLGSFREVAGVEAIAVEPLPHWLRANINISLAGKNAKALQHSYDKLSLLANQHPFNLGARKCNLVEMYARKLPNPPPATND